MVFDSSTHTVSCHGLFRGVEIEYAVSYRNTKINTDEFFQSQYCVSIKYGSHVYVPVIWRIEFVDSYTNRTVVRHGKNANVFEKICDDFDEQFSRQLREYIADMSGDVLLTLDYYGRGI